MQLLESLSDVVSQFDAIVLDQWGVLHDGSTPYPMAVETLNSLKAGGARLAVLSNSGKRAAPNAERISEMGFDADLFDVVMTSGEALWQDVAKARVAHQSLFPITRAEGDAQVWAQGLNITLSETLDGADAILLMGLPDGSTAEDYSALLTDAKALELPIVCTNPDRASPRADGATVVSPGALAHTYQDNGCHVTFYGKPHMPVFRALETALNAPPHRLLMVGDSLEHDIAGGDGAGWSTAFIRGGLHRAAFSGGAPIDDVVAQLAEAEKAPLPTFTLAQLE